MKKAFGPLLVLTILLAFTAYQPARARGLLSSVGSGVLTLISALRSIF